MPRTFDDDFIAEFSVGFPATVWHAARRGATDAEGTAAEAWARTYQSGTRGVMIERYGAFAHTCTERIVIDEGRKQALYDRAVRKFYGRSEFSYSRQLLPRGGETTTGELIDGTADPASWAEEHALEEELATIGRTILEKADPQCPMCRAHDRTCPWGRRCTAATVKVVGAATIGRLLDTTLNLRSEESVRAVAAEVLRWPNGANLEKAEATTWVRGPALCCAFLIHQALTESDLGSFLEIDLKGVPTLVRATAELARRRRATWTALMERTMREWCEANGEDWPPRSLAA